MFLLHLLLINLLRQAYFFFSSESPNKSRAPLWYVLDLTIYFEIIGVKSEIAPWQYEWDSYIWLSDFLVLVFAHSRKMENDELWLIAYHWLYPK